jgi:uncharacterized membrane protein YgcG
MRKPTSKFSHLLVFIGVLLGLLASRPGVAQEQILSFKSFIQIFADSSMEVREEIQVRAEGRQIRRGIYRDFPIHYRDRAGNAYQVGFQVISVLRDGEPETWRTEAHGNDVRVYLGRKDVYLRTGEYTYTLTYHTNRQLGFFDNHDELYWNVTGNGWAFPIDTVSVRVMLPGEMLPDDVTVEAYTGRLGTRGHDYLAGVDTSGEAVFETTRTLMPGEGLTIVVGWPKGVVTQPDATEQLAWMLRDNELVMIGLIGLILVLVYYLLIWLRLGRDLPPGTVFPRYAPPDGYSPAASRFIRRMGYDHKTFATALVNLAVKGKLLITERAGVFTLAHRMPATEPRLAPGEKVLMKTLFAGPDEVELKQKNHARISKAIKAHTQSLKRNYEKTYFVTNSVWLVPGVLLTLLVLVLIFVRAPGGDGRFALLWLGFWSVGVIFLVLRAARAWSRVRSGGLAPAIGMTLFAIPFLGGEVMGAMLMAQFMSLWVIVLIVLLMASSTLFYEWLKAPTRAGRKLLDKLEGFREYLDIAEQDEMNLKNPPDKTPQLFEDFLPFAMALDVEQHWADRFSEVFMRLAEQGQTYQPAWYHGSHWQLTEPVGFANVMGSVVSSAIASSSTAPGSSSGTGGGGFSGGGGGGGGGGGW